MSDQRELEAASHAKVDVAATCFLYVILRRLIGNLSNSFSKLLFCIYRYGFLDYFADCQDEPHSTGSLR